MGIAIILIVLSHTIAYKFITYYPAFYVAARGYFGVDIFFMLSGFGLCFSKYESIKEFYQKRLRRLLPPYITVMLCYIIIDKFGNNCHDYKYWLESISTLGYWYGGASPFWFVSGIIFMYVLFPYIKTKKRLLLWIVCSLFLCLISYTIDVISETHTFRNFTFSRIPSFCLGIYIGNLQISDRIPVKYILYSLMGLFIGGILIQKETTLNWKQACDTGILFLSFLLMLPAICYLMAFIMSHVKRKSLLAPFRMLGRISYELYLIHVVLLEYFHDSKFEISCVLSFSVVFAWLLNYLLKKCYYEKFRH